MIRAPKPGFRWDASTEEGDLDTPSMGDGYVKGRGNLDLLATWISKKCPWQRPFDVGPPKRSLWAVLLGALQVQVWTWPRGGILSAWAPRYVICWTFIHTSTGCSGLGPFLWNLVPASEDVSLICVLLGKVGVGSKSVLLRMDLASEIRAPCSDLLLPGGICFEDPGVFGIDPWIPDR